MEDKTKLKLWENIKYENKKTRIEKSKIIEGNKEIFFLLFILKTLLGKLCLKYYLLK
jgi:hypothetical protein